MLSYKPDGVLLSNGPGDPAALPYIVKATEQILGKVPIFGICLGHQILGQALGGRTEKLKFGHHGINQPVKNMQSGRIEITSQNHGFVVVPESLPVDQRKQFTWRRANPVGSLVLLRCDRSAGLAPRQSNPTGTAYSIAVRRFGIQVFLVYLRRWLAFVAV